MKLKRLEQVLHVWYLTKRNGVEVAEMKYGVDVLGSRVRAEAWSPNKV